MRGYVNEAAARAVSAQLFLCRFSAHKEPRIPHGGSNKVCLLFDERRAGVRHGQHQRFYIAYVLGLLLADGEDAAAGSVGNGEVVNQVAFAVRKRVERQVMQERMRDDNQVLGLELIAYGRDQQRVKLLQVRLRGLEQLLLQRLDVFRAQTEFSQLQLQQPKFFTHAVHVAERHNFEVLTGDQAHIKATPGGVVFQQQRILRQKPLQFLHRNRLGALQAGKLAVHALHLGERFDQRILISAAHLPQLEDTFRRSALRVQFFDLNLVVCPVEFLTQVTKLSHGRRKRLWFPGRNGRSAESNQIRQAA